MKISESSMVPPIPHLEGIGITPAVAPSNADSGKTHRHWQYGMRTTAVKLDHRGMANEVISERLIVAATGASSS
jgi:hypothetical protein